MPVAVEPPDSVIAGRHKVFTRAECVLLEKTGVLEVARYASIGGELVLQKPEKVRFITVWRLLQGWLGGDAARVAPERDVFLMSWRIGRREGRLEPEDSLVVAEAPGETLAVHLTVKAGLYARAGIAEYWVVDLQGRRVIVHRRPEDERYLDVAAYAEDEMVATLGAPEAAVRVGDLF